MSQRDLVGVFAALRQEPDAVSLAGDQYVRELRLARIRTERRPMTEPTLSRTTLTRDGADDSDVGWGDPPSPDDDALRRLLDERPPHHDRD